MTNEIQTHITPLEPVGTGHNGFLGRLGWRRLIYRRPTNSVVMAAMIGGELPLSKIEPAISIARRAIPLLGAKVVLDAHGEAWFSHEGVPPIPVQVLPRVDGDGWRRLAEAELMRDFDLSRGPLLRLAILAGKDASEVVVTCHHLICDGVCLARFIERLLYTIAGLPGSYEMDLHDPRPHDSIKIAEGQEIKGGKIPPLKRALAGAINRSWRRSHPEIDPRLFTQLVSLFQARHRTRVAVRIVEEGRTRALVDRCKKEGVTVQSALIAAFTASQHAVQGGEERYRRKVHVPVDMRRDMPGITADTFGFHASAMYPGHVGIGALPFWRRARLIHSDMQAALRGQGYHLVTRAASLIEPSLLDSLYLEKYGLIHDRNTTLVGKAFGLFDLAFGLSISNLGQLNFVKEYGTFRLESIVGPMVFSDIIEKFFGVLTNNGRMHFCMVTSDAHIDAGIADRVLDGALSLLIERSSSE